MSELAAQCEAGMADLTVQCEEKVGHYLMKVQEKSREIDELRQRLQVPALR